MVTIFDRDHEIEHHDHQFDSTTADTIWLQEISRREIRPVVVSGDLRILRNRAEAQVLSDADLTFFVLEPGWTKLSWNDQAWKFLKVWPLITAKSNPRRPSIFRVPMSTNKIDFFGLTAELSRGRKQI